MDFDGNVLYLLANVDKASFHPRIATGYLFAPDKEEKIFQLFNKKTFNQFKDPECAIFKVRHNNPKNSELQNSPVKEDVLLPRRKTMTLKD